MSPVAVNLVHFQNLLLSVVFQGLQDFLGFFEWQKCLGFSKIVKKFSKRLGLVSSLVPMYKEC